METVTREQSKEVLMDIVSAVDRFCRQQHIRYSIACGTMLGAVRHGGFIPWDDDMDIYMLRADYERLETLFPQLLEGRYALYSPWRTSRWHLPYAKVADTRTLVTDRRQNTVPIGLNIDIFIVDEVPDDARRWRRVRFWQRLLVRINIDKIYRLSRQYGWGTNARIMLCHLLPMGSRRRRLERITHYITRYNGRGNARCFEMVQGLHAKDPFPKSLFDDLTEWRFEDRVYLGFRDADNYLRQNFGDYMQLPPEERRVPTHVESSVWLS